MYFQTLKPEDATDDTPLAFPVFSHHATYDMFSGNVDFDVFAHPIDEQHRVVLIGFFSVRQLIYIACTRFAC